MQGDCIGMLERVQDLCLPIFGSPSQCFARACASDMSDCGNSG